MQINILKQKGQAALVEWNDAVGLHRATVPASAIQNDQVEYAELERGIAYGMPWETLITPSVTPQQIARRLREKGIWTEKDLQTNINAARAAFADAYTIDLKNLIDSTRVVTGGQ